MFTALADYGRLLRAGTALARHDVILPGEYHSRLPFPAKLAGKTLRIFGGGAKGRPGKRLATALEKLGPAYIKLGQFLATRPDVFGVETTSDLSRLKDKLPPFSMKAANAALEDEFGEDAARLFPDLSDPIAAASLAQVHRMQTEDGAKAVKILRPKVELLIDRELRAMKRAARTVERVNVESRRLAPVAFTETVAEAMEKELDLRLEAGGADEMRELSFKAGYYHIPAVDWERSGKRVLTTEWVDGKPLTDPQAAESPGIDRPTLANTVTRGFLDHAIHHGVFHADMHEGNMIVTPDGRLALVDFGIIGRIGMGERRFLAEILWGFLKRDYYRVAEVHFEAGYVPADRNVDEFARALRAVGEPIFGMDATRISMGRLLSYLFEVTERFGMETRTELILLQRTMVVVEGVLRSLDPEVNIWNVAHPVVEDYIKQSLGPKALAKDLMKTARVLGRFGPRLPGLVEDLLTRQSDTQDEDIRTRWPMMFLGGAVGVVCGIGAVLVFNAMT